MRLEYSHGSIGEARGLLSTGMRCNCDGPLVLLSEERQKRAKMTIFLVRQRINTEMSVVNELTI